VKETGAKLAIICIIAGWIAVTGTYVLADGSDIPEQTTTGPEPPAIVKDRDAQKILVTASEQGGVQRVISGVPNYLWRHGCGPTALGMVIGYYDRHGYDDLIFGNASTQTSNVDQAIASGGNASNPYPAGSERHYEDYASPEDYLTPTILPDDYIGKRTPHADDCIADYMDTSKSTRGNRYGWSWASEIDDAFIGYVNQQNAGYNPTATEYMWSTGALTWQLLTNEINNNRPMGFIVDTDGDGSTDHFVAVVGYDDGNPRKYGCYDTWYTNIRWETFQGMASGVPWGISRGWTFSLAPPFIPEPNEPNPVPYFPGNGTPKDPYQISTASQLDLIGSYSSLWNRYFKLVADIDLIWYVGTQFHKIGNDAVPFTGGFDGNGYRISNFTYTSLGSGEYIGLFGYIGDDGKVNDVYLTGVNLDVKNGYYVGGLAGYSSGTIKNCYVATITKGASPGVSGSDFVGGMVGVNEGTITKSYTVTDILGTDYVGGIAGFNDGSITGSNVAGYVAGWSYVGGLVGVSFMGEIVRCSSTAIVAGDCYTGGLIGLNDNGTITDCYARGLVVGNSNVGGLAGMNHNGGRITNCYSVGNVAMATSNKGGLVGYDYQAYYTKCFWEEMGAINGIGNRSDPNVISKTTAEMKDPNTFVNWDFTNVWMINEGVDYPVLIGQKYGGGAGTAENPYLIYTPEDMNAIGSDSNDWDKCFRLMADIDLGGYTGTEFKTIGNGDKPFDGIFYGCDHDDIYGNYYTISNFTCTSDSVNYAGLFGVIGAKGIVGGLVLDSVNVSAGAGYYAGGLAGVNYGTIRNCSTTGFIYAAGYAGGLVGYNYQGKIENCYSTATVIGSFIVGGLVGYGNRGTITNCYSVGAVSGDPNTTGGLMGKKFMGVFQNSFWDTQTSGQSTSAGGTGKTTAQMKTRSTFTNWDFDNLWVIEENVRYPKFWWQKYGGGKGTPENPYLIYTPGDMNSIGIYGIYGPDWLKYFKLMADIDLSAYTGTKFHRIGVIPGGIICSFSGIFDGNDHKISNFSYTSSGADYVGLFAAVCCGGQILNLELVDVNVNGGTGEYAGGLAASNEGATIRNCSTTGTVRATDFVGGLVGYNYEGTLTNCYSSAAVSGDYEIGGLVGVNTAAIEDCYADGPVTGNEIVGGLVGKNSESEDCNGMVKNCYAAGHVSGDANTGGLVGVKDAGSVTASFWDKQTSGQSSSAGGTGKTTAEMKKKITFLGEGWNFTSIWKINEGTTYPFFIWWEEINLGSSANFYDFAILANRWTQTGCNESNGYCQGADLDRSGAVDTQDMMMLSENWLR